MGFLTDARREVLADEYDGDDKAERQQKYRIRDRSREALDQLVEVAKSSAIDNSEVFDPNTVGQLLSVLFIPRAVEHYTNQPDERREAGGLLGREYLTDEYRGYADSLYFEIEREVRQYRSYGPDGEPIESNLAETLECWNCEYEIAEVPEADGTPYCPVCEAEFPTERNV